MAGEEYAGAVIRIKPVRIIRQPSFNQDLARFYVGLGLSGDDTIDWILKQCYPDLRDERLRDVRVIDRDGTDVDFDQVHIEEMFGEEPRRYVNAYKRRADRPLSRQRLHEPCVDRVTWMDVAREFRRQLGRTVTKTHLDD